MNLGERLLALRKAKQLSQEEVADRLNVTRQTVSKWETDQSTPDFDKIIPLCELYGITADELLTGEKQEQKEGRNDNISVKDNDKDKDDKELVNKKRARGISVSILIYFISVMWIMIAIPVLKMNPIVASALFLGIVGFATYYVIYTCMVYGRKKIKEEKQDNKLLKQFDSILSLVVLIIYLFVSFKTMAWHITWMIWLVYALIIEIVKLIFSLRGGVNGEE